MFSVKDAASGEPADSKPAIPKPALRRARSIPGGARTKASKVAGRTLGQSRSQASLSSTSEPAGAATAVSQQEEPQLLPTDEGAARDASWESQGPALGVAARRDGEVDVAQQRGAEPLIKFEAADEINPIGDIIADDDLGSTADLDPYGLLSMDDPTLDFSLDSHDEGEVHDTELCVDGALLLGDISMAAAGEEGAALLRLDAPLAEAPPPVPLPPALPPPCPPPPPEAQIRPKREQSLLRLTDGKDGPEKDEGGKGGKAPLGRRKMKVDWTPDLHRRFVQAVEQLGVEKAIPSRILELMNVQCLTRHNIASHLQKYRSHRRHIIAREAEATGWNRRPDSHAWARMVRDGTAAWGGPGPHPTPPPPIQPRPVIGLPLMPHPTPAAMGPHPAPHPLPMAPHGHPMGMPLHVWGHPSVDHSPAHMWQHPAMAPPPAWHSPDGTMWQYPTGPLDAWGHPTAAMPGSPCFPPTAMRPLMAPSPGPIPASAAAAADSFLVDDGAVPLAACNGGDDLDMFDVAGFCNDMADDLPKGILDAAISEALSNPLTPLPLGLKPPSMEGVMAELQRQGIRTVPPPPPPSSKDATAGAAVAAGTNGTRREGSTYPPL